MKTAAAPPSGCHYLLSRLLILQGLLHHQDESVHDKLTFLVVAHAQVVARDLGAENVEILFLCVCVCENYQP